MRSLSRFLVCAVLAWNALAADTARPSPPFTMKRTVGTPVTFSQYRGKIVAIAFIHTTCSHCQQLTTELNAIAKDYATRGVQFLECAFNGDAIPALPEFLDRFHPPFPVGYSTQAAVMSYLQYSIIDPRPLYVPHMGIPGSRRHDPRRLSRRKRVLP